MTDYYDAWPAPETDTYAGLATRFRPIFGRIAEGAIKRDRTRELVGESVRWLKDAGYGAVLLSPEDGGAGASVVDLIGLQTELAAADSNITQALRAHFGQALSLVFLHGDNAWGKRWLSRVATGAIFAAGLTEPGSASLKERSTTIRPDGDGYRLSGRKFYTTGGLYADWIDTAATAPDGSQQRALVSTTAPGVTFIDDWDGFGQQLTASGTAIFENVFVPGENLVTNAAPRPPFLTAYAQISHLATLAGIGRGAAEAAVAYTRARTRTYSHGSAPTAAADPLVQQKLGEVFARVYSANALTLASAAALERTIASVPPGQLIAEAAIARLNVEVYQAQIVVQEQILTAVTTLFDALGASALSKDLGLDRFWRNARAIASHNPIVYKERIVGDYAVNGTPPPAVWIAGTA